MLRRLFNRLIARATHDRKGVPASVDRDVDPSEPRPPREGPTASAAPDERDSQTTAPAGEKEASGDAGGIEGSIISALRTVYDPEIPVNIYEIGLIYGFEVGKTGMVDLKMTLTSPACPVAGTLPLEVERAVKAVPGVEDARVELVWDPPWNPEMMSEAARLELGML